MNQCDGCQVGAPLSCLGMHRMPDGGSMGCTADRYAQAPAAAPQAVPLTKDHIREIFLAHGFTVKSGQTDLKPYVYEAAEALLRAARQSHQESQEGL